MRLPWGVSHFFLLQVLKEAGLSENDVEIINVTPDAAAAAYQAGRVNIAVTYSPFLQKGNQAQKDGRIIYDTSKMPTAIIDVYLFSPELVEANPNATKAFVQGIFKAIKFLETNKDEALAIAGLRLQLTPEEAENQLKGVRLVDLPTNLEMLSNSQSDIYLLKHMNELSQFLADQDQISEVADMSKVLEPRFLKEVQA
jgi:NitT/TauT family transport system substrate-binding protein